MIEGNQQVAMKRGKPTFPSLFTFYSQFAALHRSSRDIPVTAAKALGRRGRITFGTQREVSWLALPISFRFPPAVCGVRGSGHTAQPWWGRGLQPETEPAQPSPLDSRTMRHRSVMP